MIMLGVTLTLGFAIWGYANNQAGVLIEGYSVSTAQHVNQLKEDFITVTISFNFANDEVTVWFYNNGKITTSVTSIFFGTSLGSLSPVSFSPPVTIAPGEIASTTFSWINLQPGETYYVKATAQYGTISVNYQGS